MMGEPGRDGKSARYYCTAGNGMEPFLIDEVKRKLAAEEVCQIPGKVLFSSSAGISRVSELKAAERLFLLLKHDSPVRLPAHINHAKAASVLQSRVLGDSNQWAAAAVTWSRLQGELADRWTTVTPANHAPGVTGKREGGGGSEEAKGETVQRGEKRSRPAQTLEKRRKRDDEEKECSGDKDAEKWTTSERERKRLCEEDDEEGRRAVMEVSSCRQNGKEGILEPDLFGRGSVCVHATPDHYVERGGGAGDFPVEHVKPGGGTDETQLQPSRTKPDPSPPISFRISCKCTGSLCRYFSTQEVSKVIGAGLSRLLGWKVDLKNPQLEVNVNLSDDHCLLGFPLTRLPLANRSYIRTTGLRSTVAWAMASLAQIQPGFCVVDPMCGVGTILIEASQEHKAVCFLGVDIDDGQLQKANENVEFAELGNRMHLLKASSMRLPVPSASVDAVVCDLPFGRKFDTKTNMAANLPLIVSEMERVLRTGGTLVLLLSPQLSCLLKKLVAQKDTGPPSNQETKPQTGTQDRPSPSLPSTKQDTGPQSGLQHSLPAPLRCLKHQATHRVSLGAIDGLIHKYVKIDT